MASPCREPALCQLYRHTFVPYGQNLRDCSNASSEFDSRCCMTNSRNVKNQKNCLNIFCNYTMTHHTSETCKNG